MFDSFLIFLVFLVCAFIVICYLAFIVLPWLLVVVPLVIFYALVCKVFLGKKTKTNENQNP